MAKNKFEISTFTTGLVGSPSETDIPDDSAAYSLNINPVAEDGTLTGINNDKVLTSGSGFTTQAKTVQTLLINRGALAATTVVTGTTAIAEHGDGLVKLTKTSHGLTAGDVIKWTSDVNGLGLNGYLRVDNADPDSDSNKFTVNLPYDDISASLPEDGGDGGSDIGTYVLHKDISAGTQDYKGAFITATTYNSSYEEKKYCFYFTQSSSGTDPDLDGFTSVAVNITTTNTAAQIAAALNTKINAQDGLVSSVDSATITISPDADVKADLIDVESTGNDDIPTQDGSYIDIDSGTITSTYTTIGEGTVINVDDMNLINLDKKDFSLFAVDYTNDKIYKWDDVYNTDSKNSLTDFKTNLQHNSVSSINQRNKNLFIGLGAGESYKTQWVGKIKKTQISQDLDSWYVVNDGLESIPESASPNNFDHIVSQQIFNNKLAFDEQQCYHADCPDLSGGTMQAAFTGGSGAIWTLGDANLNLHGKTVNSLPGTGWCFKLTNATHDSSDDKLREAKRYKYDDDATVAVGDIFMVIDNTPASLKFEYIGNAGTGIDATEPAFFMAITEGTSYISKISCKYGRTEFSDEDNRISQIDLADLIEGDTITTISQCRTPVVSGAHSTTLANYMMYGDGTVNDSGHISDQRCRPLHMMYWVGTTSGNLFRVNLMDFHSQHSSDDYKGPKIDSKLVLDYSNIGRCQDSQYDGNFKHWYGAIYGAQKFNASHWTNNSNMYIHDKYENEPTDTPNSSGLWAETYTWSNEPINSNIVGIIETWNNATSDNVPTAVRNGSDAARYVYDDDSDNAGAGANHYPAAGHMDHHHAQTFGTGTFKAYDADKTLFVTSHANELNHGFDTGNVITGFIRGDGKGHANYRGNTIVTKVRGLNEFQVQGTHPTGTGNQDSFPYYSCKVWLLWKRKDSSPHQRWDLMLYNFYPTTVQSDSVLVYDRTPAYDECEKNTFSDSNSVVNSFFSDSSGNFYIQKSSQMLGAGDNRHTSDALRDQASSYSKAKWAAPNFVYVMRRDGSSISIMNYYYHTWIGLGNYIGYDGSVTGEPRLMTPFNHSLTTCKPLEELTEDYSAIAYNTNPCSGVTSDAASLTWQKGANKHQVYFAANVSGRLAAEGFTGHHTLVDGDSDPFCFRETPFITYNETPMLVKITDTGSAKSDTRTFMGHYESTSNSSAHINQEVPFHYSDGGKFKKRCIYSTTDGTHISTRGSGEDATSLHTLYYTNGTYSLYDGTKLVPDTVPYSNASDASMLQGQIGDYLFIDRKWMSGEPRCGTTQFKRINGYMYVAESEEETANRGGRRQMQMRPYHQGWNNAQTTKIRGVDGYANGNIGWYENDPQNDGGNYLTDGHGFEKKHTGIQLVGVKSDYCITSVGSFYGDEYRHNSSNSSNSGNRYSTTNEVAQLTYDLNRYVPSFEIFGKYACEMRPLEPTSPIDKLRSIHPVANTNMSNEDNQLFASISSDIGGEYNSSLIAYDNINYSGYDATPFSFSAPNQNILTGKVSSVFDTVKTGYPKIVACPLTPNEDLSDNQENTFTIWGSGNAQISSVSKQFVAPITDGGTGNSEMGYDWGETHFDDFDIDNYISQDPLITFSNEISGGTEFKDGDNVKYKISLLYDGYQESPLSSFFYDKTMSADKASQDVTLNIAQDFVFNPRVTHINVYRKNNDNDLYRLVKEVPLESKLWKNVSGINKFTFKDSKRFASYSALTGINEENTDTSLNYSISAQINDELFVGLAWHKEVEDDVAKYIYKSKPGNFSQFDYKKDFLVLPAIPTALASFNGKIYAFDRNNTYVINPQQMFIEDTFEGVGCLSQDAFVVTEFGMCFADSNNIYLHNGSAAQPIGNNILDVSTYEGWTIGWQKAAAYSEDTVGIDPFVFYDGPTNSFVCFVHGSCDHNCNLNVSRAWVYSISRNRWDYWEAPKTKKAIQGMDGDIIISDGNLIYNYRDNTTKRDWRWLSKKLSLTKQTGTKRFHKLNLQGSPTLDTISTPPKWNDDIVVYVDGEIQQLTLQTPNVTRNKGFTKEFSGCFLYATLAVDGTTVTLKGLNQGTIGKILPPIGSYILIDEEIMLVTAQPTQQTLTVTRAQLGTAAAVHTYDETTQATEGLEGQRIYIVCPVIKLPSKCKGKNIEVKFENQKATIDSFSIEFIDKGK